MKLMPFSRDFCHDLIRSGYSHFIVRSEMPREEYPGVMRATTYRAARNPAAEGNVIAIAIEELLSRYDIVKEDSYIMIAE